jgi:metal-responsive CopG/Arc/MetJ family transcriptional regulator
MANQAKTGKRIRVVVQMTEELCTRLDLAVEQIGSDRSKFIRRAVLEKLKSGGPSPATT